MASRRGSAGSVRGEGSRQGGRSRPSPSGKPVTQGAGRPPVLQGGGSEGPQRFRNPPVGAPTPPCRGQGVSQGVFLL